MLSALPAGNHRNGCFASTENACDVSASMPKGLKPFHGSYVCIAEFLMRIRSSFFMLIVGVGFGRPEEKMQRIDAFSVVTLMENVLIFCKHSIVSKFVCYSVASKGPPTGTDASVSSFKNRPSPQVTSIDSARGIHFFEKPISKRSFAPHGLLAFVRATGPECSVFRWDVVFTSTRNTNGVRPFLFHCEPRFYLV